MPKTFLRNVRERGLAYATNDFIQRRHLRTLAYIGMAIAVTISLATQQAYNVQQRVALRHDTRAAVLATCQSDTELRLSLQAVLQDSAVGRSHQERVYFAREIARLRPHDCEAFVRYYLK